MFRAPNRKYRFASHPCPFTSCARVLTSAAGLQRHILYKHTIPDDLLPPNATPDDISAPLEDVEDYHWDDTTNVPCTPPPGSEPLPAPDSPLTPRRLQRNHNPNLKHKAGGIILETHPILDGTPCDLEGNDLDPGQSPPPRDDPPFGDFYPFPNRPSFEFAEFLYADAEMSARKIDRLLHLLACMHPNDPPESTKAKHVYSLIDQIEQGDVPWDSFTIKYNGSLPENGPVPPWMTEEYKVWFQDPLHVLEGQLSNSDFANEMDFAPKRVFRDGVRRYRDLMSGNWAWQQCDILAEDENTHGAMFVPVILGSDKTTVSVATGQNDFYPLYAAIGNVHNAVRRAHRNALSLIGFLAIPKASKEYADNADYRKFRRQLIHTALEKILSSLRPYMTEARITRCADGHFRRVIYGLGPYIADYPEQVLLACIVQNWCPKCTAPSNNLDEGEAVPRRQEHTESLLSQSSMKELWDDYGIVGDLIPFTNAFPRADIHALITPDLLHQTIKGAFKDHVVEWINDYISEHHTKSEGDKIIADIDRRIAAAPPFPGLRHFAQGRGFKQWTGNDSKGLMKVYLPAIQGRVPPEMVRAVASLIEFCYLVRRDIIDELSIDQIKASLDAFHRHREAFRCIRPEGFSLPRQHSLVHYIPSITQFGAPNGLCSSITESKHIKAVKRPYRRSNKNQALGQMLITNQRMAKLAAARVDFKRRGMLEGSGLPDWLFDEQDGEKTTDLPLPPPAPPAPPAPPPPPHENNEENDDAGAVSGPRSMSEISLAKSYIRKIPRDLGQLATHLNYPSLPLLTRRFLFTTLNPDADIPDDHDQLPVINSKVYTYNSARAVFYAPSNASGLGGMYHERIRASSSWYGGAPRYDCVFIANSDSNADGVLGLLVAHSNENSVEKPAKRKLIRRVGVSLPCEVSESPKRARLDGDSENPAPRSILLDITNTIAPSSTSMPTSISIAQSTNNRAASVSTGVPEPLKTIHESCEMIARHLTEIKKRHSDEMSRKLALDIELRKAEEKVEKLESEVSNLRLRVQELEARDGENQEKDEKLRVALAEIGRLREHSRAVGHYLIDSLVKDEEVKEELL
ncbi:hypothetical protein H0H93_014083 [Arthromyces matolae]|nr:hypothetical protein H0H93_014083 [Arthromyces matolae]